MNTQCEVEKEGMGTHTRGLIISLLKEKKIPQLNYFPPTDDGSGVSHNVANVANVASYNWFWTKIESESGSMPKKKKSI